MLTSLSNVTNQINLGHVNTLDYAADLLTKAFPCVSFSKPRGLITNLA